MRDYYQCYPAILTNTLVPQPGLTSILQNQLGVALDALTRRTTTTTTARHAASAAAGNSFFGFIIVSRSYEYKFAM